MDAIVRQIFRRLCTLDPAEEENKLSMNEAASTPDELRMNVQALPQTHEGVETSTEELEKSTSEGANLEVPEDADPRSPSSSSMSKVECTYLFVLLSAPNALTSFGYSFEQTAFLPS